MSRRLLLLFVIVGLEGDAFVLTERTRILLPKVSHSSNVPKRGTTANTACLKSYYDDNQDYSSNRQVDDVPGPENTTQESIRALFTLFNNALATRNPKIVAKRYAKEAMLLPSSNGGALMNSEAIEQFYEEYLQKSPQKRIAQGRIQIFKGWAQDAGICDIHYMSEGRRRQVKARYSFVYIWEGHQWKISHHHTSILGAVAAPSTTASGGGTMTPQRVENLFKLLQDAFEIGDAELMARRFKDNGLLLPIDVYEDPIRGQDDIRDYFEEFFEERPIISVVERVEVTIDPAMEQRWARDVGSLLITYRNYDSTMSARYSLDYVLDEDGVWKIQQFIITPLPNEWTQLHPSDTAQNTTGVQDSDSKHYDHFQTLSRPSVTEDDVRSWFDEWNAFMATGDPKLVTSLYLPQAVLVSSITSKPRSTTQEILEFYHIFLWNRPQARVLQSFVTLSSHWCKNVGVLEYTLKDPQGQIREHVRERFSFLYSYDEAAGWKIAHHHMAIAPDELQDTAQIVDEDADLRFFQ